MKRRLLRVSVLLLTWAVRLRAQHLPIRTFTTADGLGHNQVNRIVKDSRGLMWFCTPEGLSRFDGYSFTTFGIEHGLPAPGVNDLLETRAGTYWVATNNGLVRFNPRGSAQPQPAGSDDASVPPMFSVIVPEDQDRRARQITVLREGRDESVWVGTNKDLYRLHVEAGRPSLQKVDLGLPLDFAGQRFITDLFEDDSGSLWIAAFSGLYRRWPDGTTAHYGPREGFPPSHVQRLVRDRDGRLWAATRLNGLFRIHADASHRLPTIDRALNYREQNPDGLPTSWVFDLLSTTDGPLWAATARGLVRVPADADDGRALPVYSRRNGLTDYEITSLAEDAAGNLWLGTASAGAMRIERNGITTYDRSDGIEAVSAIFEDHTGALGLKGIVLGDTKTSVFEGAALNLLKTEDASLYMRFGSFDGKQFHWFVPAGISTLGWVHEHATQQLRNGEWWIGTGAGVYRYATTDRFERLGTTQPEDVISTSEGLVAPQVFRLFEDSGGHVWISTTAADTNGLAVWEPVSRLVKNLDGESGLPSLKDNLPRAFGEDALGHVWIGLAHGLVRFADHRFTTFGEAQGVPPGAISDIHLDHLGRLWLASNGGGLVLVTDESSDHPAFKHYTTAQGLSSNDIDVIGEDAQGLLYLGGGHGLDRFDPATQHVKCFTMADGLPVGRVIAAYRDRHDVVWIGLSSGLARLIPTKSGEAPAVFVTAILTSGRAERVSALGEQDLTLGDRSSSQNQLQIDFCAFAFGGADAIRYQYQLQGADTDWSPPTERRTITYARLAPGRYRFLVRAVNADGLPSPQLASITFRIASPLWLRWWVLVLAAGLFAVVLTALYRRRVARVLEMANMRTRIATDLHDDIGANLTRIALLSEVVRQRRAEHATDSNDPVAAIARIARESVSAMSDIVWAINPARDSLLDLVRRMRQHADDVFTQREIDLEFTAPDASNTFKLGVDVRRDLLLIFKEAVNNAANHSQCSRVEIALRLDGSHIVLTLSDNGLGFNPAHASAGNGLANMARRARQLHGTLEISSANGGGTSIRLSIPQ